MDENSIFKKNRVEISRREVQNKELSFGKMRFWDSDKDSFGFLAFFQYIFLLQLFYIQKI